MTLLAFLLAIGLLVTAHEWGHYRVAVACDVKVLTFSIGFGRPVLRWKSPKPFPGQDTEFVIGLIPLGGYVKMLDEADGHVEPYEAHRAFNRKSLKARAAIVAAGPIANLLLAVVLYACMFWVGQYETKPVLSTPVAESAADAAGLRSGDVVLRMGTSAEDLQAIASLEDMRAWVVRHATTNDALYLDVQSTDEVASRVLTLDTSSLKGQPVEMTAVWSALGLTGGWSRPVLGHIQQDHAAAHAGLESGDEVLRIDGQTIDDASDLRQRIRASGTVHQPELQVWDIVRKHANVQVEVTPEWATENGSHMGRIGAQVGEAPEKVWVQAGFWDGARRAAVKTRDVIGMTLDMLVRLVTGRASLDNLSGPLTMADYAGRTASMGLAAYLSYLALLSVSLGVFNLLPIPVLDGGHLLYYLYEAVRGRSPSVVWLEALQRVGLMALLGLMVFSLFNDVMRLGWLS